jgi:DNA-3-methyladenine glycosylase
MPDRRPTEPPLPTLTSFDRACLAGDPLDAARALVGAYLVREAGDDVRVGRIVEVEAYVGTGDAASHARFGPTDRNRVMWGEPGRAYVYLVYGMYDCLNVVVAPAGQPAAVLVRAVEPIAGIEPMRAARLAHAGARRHAWTDTRREAEAIRLGGLDPPRVTSGPGAVAAAFSIGRTDTGTDLCAPDGSLRLAVSPADFPTEVVATPRVGIAYAAEPWRSIAWRFVDPMSASLSGPAAASRRRSRA